MAQLFNHSAMHPDLLMLKLGVCEKYGDIYLSHNMASHNPIIQNFESFDFNVSAYPLTREVDVITTCNWIHRACTWYTSYLGVHEWTSIYACALAFMDRLAAGIDGLPRTEVIEMLKKYTRCDPSGTRMPLTHAKLEALLDEEAMARLQAHKAKRIQCHWRKVVVNPYHIVCQRRLMRELDDLVAAY